MTNSKNKYILVGYKPFSEHQTGEAKVISTHKTLFLLENAHKKTKSKLCLDYFIAKKGETYTKGETLEIINEQYKKV